MSRKEALLVSQHPFPDPDNYQGYLREFEDEGHIITAIGEVFDLSKPEDRANWYEFDLPPNLQQPASALQVKVVPDAAAADQNEYKAFLSPLLDAFELVDRAKVFIGGKDVEVVLLRPNGAKQAAPVLNGMILKGDGTWPWFAQIDGNDIVVLDAKATAFGGSSDPQDSGKTASGCATKGKPSLLGCALPMNGYAKSPAEHSALDGTPIPKMGFGVLPNCGDNPIGAHVVVTDRATGRNITVPVIDLGPAKKTGHALDLTVAAAQIFKSNATANNFGMKLDYRILNGLKIVES
jgi:hypothetical protein